MTPRSTCASLWGLLLACRLSFGLLTRLDTHSAQRIHSMIALGLSIDTDEAPESAAAAGGAAEESGDVPPPLETAGASSMEEVD